MPHHDADRNLLFGITALQNDFITRDALIAAMGAWALAKHRPIGEILVEAKALDPLDRDWLEGMFARRLAKHGNDPAASLAAISSAGSVAEDLRRSIADPDILASIAQIPNNSQTDPYATRVPDQSQDQRVDSYDSSPPAARYRKVRHHAAGNLGVVYVAHDEELNRDVALKEIKERNADHPHNQAKFLLEAEVTAGLEHPGIVPVYGLGHHQDGRPYYAMRFIRGKSLLEAIKKFHSDDSLKKDPGKRLLELQKLLRRFTDVCNAIAYAHSRGVLHRDLKPDNVMVGKYGETLVVDWGLAKALGTSGESTATILDHDDPLPEASLQPSSADSFEATQAGSLVGTPAYMSPEQAAGRLDLLGPASDIYGLGATLYHLIVGRPPISGTSLGEILGKIQAGDLTRPRTMAPWVDPALEAICLKAMAPKANGRYPTPRKLAEDLDRWIAGEPVTAYREPWTRRARRWAKKHRTLLSITTTAATVATLVIGVVAWQRFSQSQRVDASASAALEETERLEARALAGEPTLWPRSVDECQRAVDMLRSGGSAAMLVRAIDRLKASRAEATMVSSLDEARLRAADLKGGQFDLEAKAAEYLAAFSSYGIDVATLSIEEAASRIQKSKLAADLIVALDDWRADAPKNVSADRLGAIARAAEIDPACQILRDAVDRKDAVSLRRVCENEAERQKLGRRLRSTFIALMRIDPAGSFAQLEAIRGEDPGDFWLNHDLGYLCMKASPGRFAEAMRYLAAAVAVRPDSPVALTNLGQVLGELGKYDEAEAAFRRASRLRPDYVGAKVGMATILGRQGRIKEAIDAYRAVLRIPPPGGDGAGDNHGSYAEAHIGIGAVLQIQGKYDEAIAEYREAIRLLPERSEAHSNLGISLINLGRVDEAIAEYREAIRLQPGSPDAHHSLASALIGRGELDAAAAEEREAIRLRPKFADAHNNLGGILGLQGRFAESAAEFRETLQLRPVDGSTLRNLAGALQGLGRFREALEHLIKADEIDPQLATDGHRPGEAVIKARRLVELEQRLPVILQGKGQPRDSAERLELASFCYQIQRYQAASKFAEEAFAEFPALAEDLQKGSRYDAACSASLAGSGRGKDEPGPDASAMSGLREKARGWLHADLITWGKVLDGGNEPSRKQTVLQQLSHWKDDPDLAGIRDEASLAKLPEAEREAFRKLWADVEALRVKAGGK